MLQGKCIILGISGGIAAYKAVELLRLLKKENAELHVIMTQNATEFVAPLTFQTLSGNPVHTGQFNLIDKSEIKHISLADRADLVLVCPATANIMGKVAHGIADDLLSTTIMATKAPVLFAPAMNVNMWQSPALQANLKILSDFGYQMVEPGSGELACGWEGKGRLADLDSILNKSLEILLPKPLKNKKIVITAGPTREALDPVRFISNRSSGKMGFALARAATLWGAQVTLVAGPASISPYPFVRNLVRVESARQMLDETQKAFQQSDALIMCAAVADFRPQKVLNQKSPKKELMSPLELVENPDIIQAIAREKGGKLVVGFAAETDQVEKKAREKMERKGLDFIVCNDVSRPDIGFECDENEVRIFGREGQEFRPAKCSKNDLAFDILKAVFDLTIEP